MRAISIILLLFTVPLLAFAQTGNYKRIMEDKKSMDLDAFISALKEYQQENAEYGNVYYQLGQAELARFSKLDPITERTASRQYVYNAKTNFGLAKNFLDERDISKNPEWYDAPDIKDKDSLLSLGKGNVNNKYEDVSGYLEKYEELLQNHDSAVANYLRARELFIEINTSADNLRELFLEADDSLKLLVSQVGEYFEESLTYLDNYRSIYQQMPHEKKRKVDVNLIRIDHFRMNGITPVNFLNDQIDLWDYKGWSERFLGLVQQEVDGLHDEINNAFNYFMTTNDRLLFGDECIQANLDAMKFQRIINLITKYDINSVLVDMFQFSLAKLEYGNQLAYEVNCNDFKEAPSDDFMSRKARIYKNLFEAYRSADSLNTFISEEENNEESFQWFFNETYTQPGGSAAFATSQKQQNDTTFKRELTKMDQYLTFQRFDMPVDTTQNCYFMSETGLMTGYGSADESEQICVSKILPLREDFFLLQASRGENNLLMAALPSDGDYERIWEVPTYKNGVISFFKTISDSLFVIGGNDWLQIVQGDGEVKQSLKLKSSDSIRSVSFSELQGELTIVQSSETEVTVSSASFSGNVAVSLRKEIEGDFLAIVKQGGLIRLITHVQGDEGSIVRVYLQGETGEWTETNYYFSNDLVDPYLIKNDDEYLTVLARNLVDESQHVYSILNYEGDVKYEAVF